MTDIKSVKPVVKIIRIELALKLKKLINCIEVFFLKPVN